MIKKFLLSFLFGGVQHKSVLEHNNNNSIVFAGTTAYVEFEKIVLDKRLLKDVRNLSTRQLTSSLEAFNSLLLQFAPKLRAFSHRGMLCR